MEPEPPRQRLTAPDAQEETLISVPIQVPEQVYSRPESIPQHGYVSPAPTDADFIRSMEECSIWTGITPASCQGPRSLWIQSMTEIFRTELRSAESVKADINWKLNSNCCDCEGTLRPEGQALVNLTELVYKFGTSKYIDVPYSIELLEESHRYELNDRFAYRFDIWYIKETFFENTFMCEEINLDTIRFQSDLTRIGNLEDCLSVFSVINFDMEKIKEDNMTEYWCCADVQDLEVGLNECYLRALDGLLSLYNQVATVEYLSRIAFENQPYYLQLLGWEEDNRIKSSNWCTSRPVYGCINYSVNTMAINEALEMIDIVANRRGINTMRLYVKYKWSDKDIQEKLKLLLVYPPATPH